MWSTLDLATCHQGSVWLGVETERDAAHGSRPKNGIDAIAKMVHVLAGVDGLASRLQGGLGHPQLGTGSIHASLTSSGQELSSYPGCCRLALERRTIPRESAEDALADIQVLPDQIQARDARRRWDHSRLWPWLERERVAALGGRDAASLRYA